MIKVDTSLWKSSYAKVYTNDTLSDEVLISVGEDSSCVITDVYLATNANIGAVKLDFDGGDPIARLYSSQFNRFSFNDSKHQGDSGEDVVLTADIGEEEELFVKINYII